MNPIRKYYKSGWPSSEEWRVDGKRHRVDGPAWQEWLDNDRPWVKEWAIDGKWHRVDGPAFQGWHTDGQLWKEGWWIEGKKVEPISDPLAWTLFIAKNFGNVHGLEKFISDNIEEKKAKAIIASARIM